MSYCGGGVSNCTVFGRPLGLGSGLGAGSFLGLPRRFGAGVFGSLATRSAGGSTGAGSAGGSTGAGSAGGSTGAGSGDSVSIFVDLPFINWIKKLNRSWRKQ